MTRPSSDNKRMPAWPSYPWENTMPFWVEKKKSEDAVKENQKNINKNLKIQLNKLLFVQNSNESNWKHKISL